MCEFRKGGFNICESEVKAIRAIAAAVMDGKIRIVGELRNAKAPYSYTPYQFAKMIYTFADNALFRF